VIQRPMPSCKSGEKRNHHASQLKIGALLRVSSWLEPPLKSLPAPLPARPRNGRDGLGATQCPPLTQSKASSTLGCGLKDTVVKHLSPQQRRADTRRSIKNLHVEMLKCANSILPKSKPSAGAHSPWSSPTLFLGTSLKCPLRKRGEQPLVPMGSGRGREF
jgi:hypothetical protein